MRWIEKLMIILALTCFLQVMEVSAADPYIINSYKDRFNPYLLMECC